MLVSIVRESPRSAAPEEVRQVEHEERSEVEGRSEQKQAPRAATSWYWFCEDQGIQSESDWV